ASATASSTALFRSWRVGWPGELIGLLEERGRIEHAVLQKRRHEFDDDAAEVFRRQREGILGLREEGKKRRGGHGGYSPTTPAKLAVGSCASKKAKKRSPSSASR